MIKTWRGYIGIYRPLGTLIKPTATAGKNCTALSKLALLIRLNKVSFNVIASPFVRVMDTMPEPWAKNEVSALLLTNPQ